MKRDEICIFTSCREGWCSEAKLLSHSCCGVSVEIDTCVATGNVCSYFTVEGCVVKNVGNTFSQVVVRFGVTQKSC